MKKIHAIIAVISLFMFAKSITAETKLYKQELKKLKKTDHYQVMFDKETNVVLRNIIRDVENLKELSPFQRLIRSAFLALDTVVITKKTMPKLHEYIVSLCAKHNLHVPTLFITKDKWFFNAAAQKLAMSSGAIVIGQDLLNKCSDDELEAIIAHEIGHIYHNHINKQITTLLSCMGASLISGNLMRLSIKNNNLELAAVCGGVSLFSSFILPLLIIGKKHEREADLFALKSLNKNSGLIKFFERLKKKDQKKKNDFNIVSNVLSENSSKIKFDEWVALNLNYYIAKVGFKIDSGFKWLYHNTPWGAHPSHNDRIRAAKKHFGGIIKG